MTDKEKLRNIQECLAYGSSPTVPVRFYELGYVSGPPDKPKITERGNAVLEGKE